MAPQVAGDARARDAADLSRNLLDRHHQRETEDERPRQTIAEFGADLAMGAYAARVVVRGTGDKSRSEGPQESAKSARATGIGQG